jgi:hypothetical protein
VAAPAKLRDRHPCDQPLQPVAAAESIDGVGVGRRREGVELCVEPWVLIVAEGSRLQVRGGQAPAAGMSAASFLHVAPADEGRVLGRLIAAEVRDQANVGTARVTVDDEHASRATTLGNDLTRATPPIEVAGERARLPAPAAALAGMAAARSSCGRGARQTRWKNRCRRSGERHRSLLPDWRRRAPPAAMVGFVAPLVGGSSEAVKRPDPL